MGIDFGMLEMMKIGLKEGRYLTEKLASDTINTMLINETSMKLMKEKNPLGKEVEWNGNKLKIVGVVKDFNLYSPQAEVPPMVFFHFKTIDWMLQNASRIHVKVDGKNMEQTIADIEKFWTKNVDSEYPFEYDFVDKAYARTYEAYVKQRNLFDVLGYLEIKKAKDEAEYKDWKIKNPKKDSFKVKKLQKICNTCNKELEKNGSDA
jgi:putative ABC transport system permease protein